MPLVSNEVVDYKGGYFHFTLTPEALHFYKQAPGTEFNVQAHDGVPDHYGEVSDDLAEIINQGQGEEKTITFDIEGKGSIPRRDIGLVEYVSSEAGLYKITIYNQSVSPVTVITDDVRTARSFINIMANYRDSEVFLRFFLN